MATLWMILIMDTVSGGMSGAVYGSKQECVAAKRLYVTSDRGSVLCAPVNLITDYDYLDGKHKVRVQVFKRTKNHNKD